MSANNEPPADAESKTPDEKVPVQRRIFGTKRIVNSAADEARPDLEEKLAHLVDSVKVLQSHIIGGKPADETPVETEPKQRRLKRFQRSASEETPEPDGEPVLDHEVSGDEVTLNKNIAWPRLTRVDEVAANLRARAAGRKQPILIWALVQLTGLGLLLIGFWAGQSLSGDEEDHPAQTDLASPLKPPVADLLARVGLNDRALGAANLGLHAEKTGDTSTARQTWDSAVAGQVWLPGADYRLAMLDIQKGDLTSADIHLSRSLAAGEMMASCYFVNACFAGKKSDYAEAARQMAHAVRVEPFNAKYLFCWGETLRRAGKSQAGDRRDQRRPSTDPPRRPISSCLPSSCGMAKIEAGHDEAFDAELADHLAKTPVTGDWLLLAAARDLTRSAFPAAAGHLRDAAHVLPPEVFNLLVQDFALPGLRDARGCRRFAERFLCPRPPSDPWTLAHGRRKRPIRPFGHRFRPRFEPDSLRRRHWILAGDDEFLGSTEPFGKIDGRIQRRIPPGRVDLVAPHVETFPPAPLHRSSKTRRPPRRGRARS